MDFEQTRKVNTRDALRNDGPPRATLKIGLVWHNFASKNLGVAALAYSHLNLLMDILRTKGLEGRFFAYGDAITSGSQAPIEMDRDIRIEYAPISLRRLPQEIARDPRGALLRFRGCDVVFDNSAGDSFTDIYGWKRFWTQAFYKMSIIGSGVPLILSPQTIGPFRHALSRMVGIAILRRCRLISVRDSASLGRLVEYGLEAKAVLSTDVAFTLPHGTSRDGPINHEKIMVGVNVSGLLLNGGYNRANQFGLKFRYKEFVLRLIDALYAFGGVEVVLVPHAMSSAKGGIDDDFSACNIINRERPRTIVAPRFEGPSQAKNYISRLDFFVGSRMHSTIAAFSSGVPVVPVAYSTKFRRLFFDLGYSSICDARRQGVDAIIDTVLQCLTNRDALAKQIVEGNKLAKDKLNAYKRRVSYLVDAIAEKSVHEVS